MGEPTGLSESFLHQGLSGYPTVCVILRGQGLCEPMKSGYTAGEIVSKEESQKCRSECEGAAPPLCCGDR